jgi:TonB family protein
VAATANGLWTPRLDPREVSLPFAGSLLLHAALVAAALWLPGVFFAPHVITVPPSYSVSLVTSLPESGSRPASPPRPAPPRPAPPPPAPKAPSAPPAPTPPPVVARPAPAPPPAPAPSDDLALPGRQAVRKSAPVPEASLRPPTPPRPTPPRAPSPPLTPPPPPVTRAVPPAPPAPIPAPAPPLAPAAPPVAAAPPPAVTASKSSGPELASSGTGAGEGSTLAYYLTLVDRKIQENWNPVGAAPLPEIVVVVRFRVLRSGQVKDLELETGSGLRSLDEAAMRAIRQSLPLPPFPNLLAEPSLDLRYRFVMEQ